ncbi:hypothetical protein J4410_03610 [Candidatus Woesearchaeota archaeon]|nr:hypothetical protein [Candidatus Woesearchaeota archaeon]
MQDIKKEGWRFIVIGGWATYLWTRQHKSKDIDIIIPDFDTLSVLKKKYDLKKNDHLKKYEILFGAIDVDLYVPYYSQLTLPIEIIAKQTSFVEGFEVIKPEVLLILKQGAEQDRSYSVKGQKDRIDIMTLLCFTEIDFAWYRQLLKTHHLEPYRLKLKNIIQTFKDLKYLEMNAQKYAKIKKDLLKKIG